MRRRFAAALALALLVPLPGLAGEVVVKSGETLSEIADRYGTTVNRLMEMNGLRSANDLWAGSRLKVPGNVYSGSGSGNYTVKSGETLSEIADRYGTTVDKLMRLNGLRDANDLWAGSRIQVPGASPRASQAAVNRNASRHTVQDGETLSEIASRYGVSMDRLVALN
ncbi:MAG: LysM peptidoglycan-binding domain-containing protein, partial [Vulcanococcus sp.]